MTDKCEKRNSPKKLAVKLAGKLGQGMQSLSSHSEFLYDTIGEISLELHHQEQDELCISWCTAVMCKLPEGHCKYYYLLVSLFALAARKLRAKSSAELYITQRNS